MKKSGLELVKNIEDVNYVANLVVNICDTHNIQFIFLEGDIGVGKTTLVKEIANYLEEPKENVTSPTFNKMFVYDKFVHIDAYNFDDKDWLKSNEEYFEDKLVIIEWPEKINTKNIKGLNIKIEYIDDKTRKYIINWKE